MSIRSNLRTAGVAIREAGASKWTKIRTSTYMSDQLWLRQRRVSSWTGAMYNCYTRDDIYTLGSMVATHGVLWGSLEDLVAYIEKAGMVVRAQREGVEKWQSHEVVFDLRMEETA